MSAPSSDDARGVPSGSSVPAYPGYAADDPKISAYLAHLAHVGDEMATGLGALFADQFPEVPSLELIHEGFTFSKNDSLLLFASLEGNALTLAQCQAEGGTAAELIGRVLGHIADLHEGFLRTVMAASSPTSGDVPPTTSSSSVFATPAAHPAQLNLSGGDRRGAGQGAPGISPGALAGPDGSQPVFIQRHDEREDVDEGDGHPGDLPGDLPATALAIQDLRGNSARLKAAYEASLRDLQTADTAASATAASAARVPAGLNPAAISVDLSLPLALRSVGRSPSVPAAVRQDFPAQLVPPAAVGAAPAAAPTPAPVVAAPAAAPVVPSAAAAAASDWLAPPAVPAAAPAALVPPTAPAPPGLLAAAPPAPTPPVVGAVPGTAHAVPASIDSSMYAVLQQQLNHSQVQQQQQHQQFQIMMESMERRAQEQATESRLAREAAQAHNAEVVLRLSTQLEENKASLEELKAAASATPKKEVPLEYTPHYDGHTHSPGLVEGEESTIQYSPWQKGRDRSKAAHQGGDKPRPLDCSGTPTYDVLTKSKDIKKSGRYHEYTNLYSGCSFLWDVLRFLTDMTPLLLDKDQPMGVKADTIDRVHNSLTGIYDLLNLRANVVELLVVKDCADGTFSDEERARADTLIAHMEKSQTGFGMKLGNESDIHNGLRKAKESMDIKVEEAYNRSLAKTCAEAAVKALSSGSSSSKKVPFKPKTRITVTGNGPVSAAAGAAKAASKST